MLQMQDFAPGQLHLYISHSEPTLPATFVLVNRSEQTCWKNKQIEINIPLRVAATEHSCQDEISWIPPYDFPSLSCINPRASGHWGSRHKEYGMKECLVHY